MAGAACLVAGAGLWLAASSTPDAPVSGYTATPPTPLLDPRPDSESVRSIRIAADRSTATLARDGDRWVVRELADYPITDVARVEALIDRLSSLTARYRATVDTAETPPVKPTSVTLETDDAATPKRLAFGNSLTVPGESDRLVAVWRDDEARGWLTELTNLPEPHPAAWTDRTLVAVSRDRMLRTRIEVDGSGRLAIERKDETLVVAVEGRADAGLTTTAAELSVIMAMLEKLEFTDARRREAAPTQDASGRPVAEGRRAIFETEDGLLVRIELRMAGREPWASLTAETTPDASEPVRARAHALSERFGERDYLVGTAVVTAMVDWPDRILAR